MNKNGLALRSAFPGHLRRKATKGFSLIELLVVTAIILVIVGAVSGLFFSSLKGSTKTTIINEAKQNGDYALSIMERMIRNAVNIPNLTTVCDGATGWTLLIIDNPDGGQTTFQCPAVGENRIASNSATTTGFLTSEKVQVTNCSFTCVRQSASSPAIIKIAFTVQQPSPTTSVTLKPEETVSINFETSVVARNTGY